MGKVIFTIEVDTKEELTEEQVIFLRQDIGARLQGYHTQPLEYMTDASMSLNFSEPPYEKLESTYNELVEKSRKEMEEFDQDLGNESATFSPGSVLAPEEEDSETKTFDDEK